MKITRLRLNNFRNIEAMTIVPNENFNVILGNNGQGKTNIMEAIWLFTGAKSFRAASPTALVKNNCKYSQITIEFDGGGRDNTALLRYGENKTVHLNEIPVLSAISLTGVFKAVVFSPSHLSIIKDDPKERRAFLDIGICQLKPRYASVLKEYRRILEHRNSLLRSGYSGKALYDQLDIFDIQLSKVMSILSRTRATYLDKIAAKAVTLYSDMCSGKEQLELRYSSSIEGFAENGYDDQFALAALTQSRTACLKAKNTTIGTHRDDIMVNINSMSARLYGSQGQQRTAVLALKLAEAEVFYQQSGEYPVVLLDDVMSELDGERREFLIYNLSGPQIFVTCCEPLSLKQTKHDNIIHIKDGAIV